MATEPQQPVAWSAPDAGAPVGPGGRRGWAAPEAGAELPRAREADPTRPVRPDVPLPVTLRPLGAPAQLDGALDVLAARPRVLLLSAAVPLVPVLAVAFVVRGGPYRMDLATWLLSTFDEADPMATALDERAWAVWATAVLETLAVFLVGAVVARVVAAWYAGSDPGPGRALRDGLQRPGALLGAFALLTAAKALGGLVLCVGALVPVVWLAVTAPALAVEQLPARAAVARSYRLVGRRFMPVLGMVLLVAVVDQLLRVALVLIPWLLAGGLPDAAALVVRVLVVTLAGLVSVVFVGGAATLLYLDLRVRTEGLDLELEATDAFPRA